MNALGHVPAGKRCATDVVDAFVESEPRARSFADELLPPITIEPSPETPDAELSKLPPGKSPRPTIPVAAVHR